MLRLSWLILSHSLRVNRQHCVPCRLGRTVIVRTTAAKRKRIAHCPTLKFVSVMMSIEPLGRVRDAGSLSSEETEGGTNSGCAVVSGCRHLSGARPRHV